MGWEMRAGAVGLEYLGRYIVRNTSEAGRKIENKSSKNPLNSKNGNPPHEDEYMKDYGKDKNGKIIPLPPHKPEVFKLVPMRRDVSSWNKEDIESVMRSQDYRYDEITQKKVKRYFDYKYPRPQRLDAIGRQIDD